jgi:hypothetical protein
LYTQWPVKLPPQPIPWDVERRLNEDNNKYVRDMFMEFASKMPSTRSDENGIPMMAHAIYAMAEMMKAVKAYDATPSVEYEPCGMNITCHAMNVVNHIPAQDHDGDRFSIAEVKKLRGSDWRGADCDDKHANVYPGRKVNDHADESDVDHNCNGIYGGNSTGTYEELFCSDNDRRGIILLGDSATAHFHIPPQWVTAQGWNLDGLLPIAADELDFPMCRFVS